MAGLTIDVVYDASVEKAPPGFKTTVAAAVSYIESLFSTPITVTIDVGYGEVDGRLLGDGDLGESKSVDTDEWYYQLRPALLSRTATAAEVAAAASLPATDPTGGGLFFVTYAEAEALGLSGPPDDSTSVAVGEIGLSDTAAFTYGTTNGAAPGTYDAFGVIEHEITEVLGRTATAGAEDGPGIFNPLDLFRYASPGVRALSPGVGSFSINGTTLLDAFNDSAAYGGDPGDWASSVTDDSFDAFSSEGVANVLSAVDLEEMDVLGYTPVPADPVIGGAVTGQAVTDQATIAPFAGVTVADSNYQPTETLTVRLSAAANGTLTNLGGGSYNTATGVYAVTGSAAAVTGAIDGLVFVPTVVQVPGQQTTTLFVIADSDSAGATAKAVTASVVSTNITVVLNGPSTEYAIADNNGSVYIQDNGSAGDGTRTLPNVKELIFTNGIGIFDPTGAAEDVARLYDVALNRPPDAAGLLYWTSQIDDSNVPLSVVATDFTASPEFIADYGSLSNETFVDRLYENALGRMPDQAGAAYWEGLLNNGTSRGAVLVGFAESAEYEADTVSTAGDPDNAEVDRLYQAALDRAPDPSGLAFWTSALASGATPTEVAQDLASSAEFLSDYGTQSANAFVTTLYENVLHRAPDSSGLAYWTGVLQQGGSEASVVVGFADSLENLVQTASATHANWVFIPT